MIYIIFILNILFSCCAFGNNLLSLLQNPKSHVSTQSKKPSDQIFNTLFAQVSNKQNNKAYQSAVAILNNEQLLQEYQQNVFEIELILSNYSTQILQKLNQAWIKDHKNVSLIELLKTVAPQAVSNKSSAIDNLSTMLSMMQPYVQPSKSDVSNESLLSLIQTKIEPDVDHNVSKSTMLDWLHATNLKPANKEKQSNILGLLSRSEQLS